MVGYPILFLFFLYDIYNVNCMFIIQCKTHSLFKVHKLDSYEVGVEGGGGC